MARWDRPQPALITSYDEGGGVLIGWSFFQDFPDFNAGLEFEPSGQFAAFCICWMDEANQVGHLEPVGTHPRFRRKGLGAAVVSEGLQRMKARGMRAAGVWMESGNRAAQRLCELVGFRKVLRIDTYVNGL